MKIEKMNSDGNVPPEVSQVLAQYKVNEQSMKAISSEVKKLKDSMDFKKLLENRNKIKAWLYQYMTENKLEELDGIKLQMVSPSKEKKEQRKAKKMEQVEEILYSELELQNESEIENLIMKLDKVL